MKVVQGTLDGVTWWTLGNYGRVGVADAYGYRNLRVIDQDAAPNITAVVKPAAECVTLEVRVLESGLTQVECPKSKQTMACSFGQQAGCVENLDRYCCGHRHQLPPVTSDEGGKEAALKRAIEAVQASVAKMSVPRLMLPMCNAPLSGRLNDIETIRCPLALGHDGAHDWTGRPRDQGSITILEPPPKPACTCLSWTCAECSEAMEMDRRRRHNTDRIDREEEHKAEAAASLARPIYRPPVWSPSHVMGGAWFHPTRRR